MSKRKHWLETDLRNRYRAVSRMTTDGEFWTVQVRVWWWPFWLTVDAYKCTLERARTAAINHASKGWYLRRVVEIGPL